MNPAFATLVQLAMFLVASTQASDPVLPRYPSPRDPFPSHCLVRQSSDPNLTSYDCQAAISLFAKEYPSSISTLSNQPSSSNDTGSLPWDRTVDGCRIRVELIYADQVQANTNDILLAGDHLDSACVGDPQYLGGRIFLNEQGLTLSLRPSVECDWEERFNQSSVVVGQSSETIASPTLYTVTGTAGSTS